MAGSEPAICAGKKVPKMIMNNSRFFTLNSGAALLLLSVATGCGDSGTDDGSGGSESGGNGNASGGAASGGSGNASGGSGNASGGSSADGGLGGDSGGDGGAGGDRSEEVVDLGSAADFVILAKSEISTVPTSEITGNVGVSPAAATYITGFDLVDDASGEFSMSPQITGNVFAADYDSPTPSDLTTAVGDMETAFTDAAGRSADVTELGAGDIGGMTLDAGVYKWGTGLLIPTDVTLSGNATDVWIFQIAEDLTVDSATNVFLTGGAVAENVFWQVSGKVELGTTSHFEGIVLSQTAVTLATGASLNGRVLAQTAVTLDGNVVVEPND